MADEFLTRTCSNSWWSSSRNAFTGLSSPCSTSIGEMGSFGWSFAGQDAAFPSGADHIPIGLNVSRRATATESDSGSNLLIDSELPMSAFGLSSPNMDWNHSLLTGRNRSNFPSNSYSLNSSFEYPSPFLQELFEPDSDLTHHSSFENQTAMSFINSSSEQLHQSWPKILPQLLKITSPAKQPAGNQLHLSNSHNSDFWNTVTDESKASLYSPPDEVTQSQLFANVFEDKQSSTNVSNKRNTEEIPDACSKKTRKQTTSSEGSFKRLRMETPSPLPTFKVRKEKLGDRVTALQQLVSPFGKTDTASVLHEAIEYIKFLHDQVNVLSTPYMKNGAPMQQHQNLDHLLQSKDGCEEARQDLLTRGLCLMPVSTTFAVTNESTADFWTPSFGGAFR